MIAKYHGDVNFSIKLGVFHSNGWFLKTHLDNFRNGVADQFGNGVFITGTIYGRFK